jgi:hypothetical protein
MAAPRREPRPFHLRRQSAYTIIACFVVFYIVSQTVVLIFFHLNSPKLNVGSDSWQRGFVSYGTNVHTQRFVSFPLYNATAEKAQALLYTKSFQSLERPLKFLHIPKTAGSAIENAAGENGINWGSCAFFHKPKRDICDYPGTEWPMRIGWWHLPTYVFPLAESDPYQHAEVFGVIRDPYERMVSEFYYICTLKVKDWRPDQCNRSKLHESTYMNQWLMRKMHDRETKTAAGYLLDNGHFTPQFEYIVGPHETRYVDYILRLDDTLNPQFAHLMQVFGLGHVKLKKFQALGSAEDFKDRSDDTHLTTDALDKHTLDWIHNRYSQDFLDFGYVKRAVV